MHLTGSMPASKLQFRASGSEYVLDAVAVLSATLIFVDISLVGRLYVSEILLAALFPILFFTKSHLLLKTVIVKLAVLASIWLAVQVLTDIYRGTPFVDYARGWAKISMLLVNLLCLTMLLLGNVRRLRLFALGLGIGGILAYFFNPSEYTAADFWKFGIGYPTTLTCVVFLTFLRSPRRLSAPIVLLALSMLNLYMGARSLSGVCFVAGIYLFARPYLADRQSRALKLSARSIMFSVIIVLGAGYGALYTYEYAVRDGLLGENARIKYEQQNAGDFGYLVGGRLTDAIMAAGAIYDSPFIGYGSWAKSDDFFSIGENLNGYGYTLYMKPYYDSGLIPSHSHLLGAWVEAGIVGAVFWLFVMNIIVRTLISHEVITHPLFPLITYIGLLFAWDILLSPFGADRHLTTAFYLVLLLSTGVQPKRLIPALKQRRPALAGNDYT